MQFIMKCRANYISNIVKWFCYNSLELRFEDVRQVMQVSLRLAVSLKSRPKRLSSLLEVHPYYEDDRQVRPCLHGNQRPHWDYRKSHRADLCFQIADEVNKAPVEVYMYISPSSRTYLSSAYRKSSFEKEFQLARRINFAVWLTGPQLYVMLHRSYTYRCTPRK